jgi:hypothetical protein
VLEPSLELNVDDSIRERMTGDVMLRNDRQFSPLQSVITSEQEVSDRMNLVMMEPEKVHLIKVRFPLEIDCWPMDERSYDSSEKTQPSRTERVETSVSVK